MIFAAPAETPLLVRRSLTRGRPVVEVSCVMGATASGVLAGTECLPFWVGSEESQ